MVEEFPGRDLHRCRPQAQDMGGHLPPHILPTCSGLPTPTLTPQAMPVQVSTLPLFSMLDGPLISFHSINLRLCTTCFHADTSITAFQDDVFKGH